MISFWKLSALPYPCLCCFLLFYSVGDGVSFLGDTKVVFSCKPKYLDSALCWFKKIYLRLLVHVLQVRVLHVKTQWCKGPRRKQCCWFTVQYFGAVGLFRSDMLPIFNMVWPLFFCATVFVCPHFPYLGNDMIFQIFPVVRFVTHFAGDIGQSANI